MRPMPGSRDRGRDDPRGELRRQEVLGTEAVYRIVDVQGELVEVEVVRAPGLAPGRRLRLTADAVQRMQLIE
jgi:hypothetical protein